MRYEITEVKRYVAKDGDREVQFFSLEDATAWFKRKFLEERVPLLNSGEDLVEILLNKVDLIGLADELRTLEVVVVSPKVDDAPVAEWLDNQPPPSVTLPDTAKTVSEFGGVLDDQPTKGLWTIGRLYPA